MLVQSNDLKSFIKNKYLCSSSSIILIVLRGEKRHLVLMFPNYLCQIYSIHVPRDVELGISAFNKDNITELMLNFFI